MPENGNEMGANSDVQLCCISHAFSRAASTNPHKIVLIHALGGSRISRHYAREVAGIDEEEFLRSHRDVDSPPLYPGDVSYTYGELQSAVNALASRITNVLSGGQDPDLLPPTGFELKEVGNDFHFEGTSIIGLRDGQRTSEKMDMIYKDIPSTISLSRHTIEKQAQHYVGYCSSPETVGIYLVPSAEYIVAVLAVLRSGGVFLPIDPSLPKERVLAIASASKVRLIISCRHSPVFHDSVNHELEWLFGDNKYSVLCLSDGYSKGFLGEVKSKCDLSWPCQSKEQRLYCYVMYTSGSSGKPKGVCGTEKGLLNRFVWMETQYPVLAHDVSCFKTAISFIDHLSEILGPLLSCTTLVIPPFDELKKNPLLLFGILKAYHVTRLTAVPSLLRALLPILQSSNGRLIQKFLQVLVLSGEAFPIWLWEVLHETLPDTSILNLYGTTEVSGDCAYFDCKSLPKLLKDKPLSSVPIGKPILGCELMLAAEKDSLDSSNTEGEIWVGGDCVAVSYFDNALENASKFIHLKNAGVDNVTSKYEVKDPKYFRTGDFARKLNDGNYVFVGRKDRMVKVNGQKIALEEIENNLRKHPDVADAAVSCHYDKRDEIYITAYIVLKVTDQLCTVKQQLHSHLNDGIGKNLHASWRNWLQERLPSAMTPHMFHIIESLPLSPAGKIDYMALPQIEPSVQREIEKYGEIRLEDGSFQIIKEAFRRALMVEKVSDSADLFLLGGTSISAAQVAYTLGIDMHFIYKHPSPQKLHNAMLQVPGLLEGIRRLDSFPKLVPEMSNSGNGKGLLGISDLNVPNMVIKGSQRPINTKYEEVPSISGSSNEAAQTFPKEEINSIDTMDQSGINKSNPRPESYVFRPEKKQCFLQSQTENTVKTVCKHWSFDHNLPGAVAFTRCNKIISQGEFDNYSIHQASHAVFRNKSAGNMCQLWKVSMHACVDASPLVVRWGDKCYLFIGSHAHNFFCIDAISGEVKWEAELGGRVECTAAITDDFTQVVVGCYNGTLYFLELLSGKILWTFQTGAEVKSQPITDQLTGLIWCGSHDHNIYALDPRSQSCVLKLPCGGSIYGAPVYDTVRIHVYVASTSGRVTAINLEGSTFNVSWSYESQAPVFGSLAVDSCSGYVLCSLVNGSINALSTTGTLVWQAKTGGPIFSGPCISTAVSSQVLVCSRDGFVYSFNLKQGNCLWKHLIGEPITSSAYVDETIQLVLQHDNQNETVYRLVCVCSSSGSIHLLMVDSDAANRYNHVSDNHFTGPGEAQNASLNNPKLTYGEGQTQNSFPSKVCTNSEGLDSNVQFTFSHEFAKLELSGDSFSSPVMFGGRIFVGCRDDHVYCIDTEL